MLDDEKLEAIIDEIKKEMLVPEQADDMSANEMPEASELPEFSEEPDGMEEPEESEEIVDAEAPATHKSKNNIKKTVLTYLHDLVYLLAVVLLVFLVFLRVVVVSGPSMNGTLKNGDYLLLLNGMFFRDYKQGDIIVASKDSFRDGEPIVKRVIATEGQTVNIDFEEGIVYVDGVALDEPYVSTPTNLYEGTTFPLVVEKGHIFVLGDNRNNSKDSRSPEIGLIDCREVLGKAIFLVFPGADANEREFNRIGVIR